MRAEEFDRLYETWDQNNMDITNGYYPTVTELKQYSVENQLEKYANILTYFASDPFSKLYPSRSKDEDYQEMVNYCNKILYGLEITE